MPAEETKQYRVSLADGTDPAVVTVPLQQPLKRKLRRHVEVVRDLADGRKKIDLVPTDVDHVFDAEAEMRADAVREYNRTSGRSVAAKNLIIEPVEESTSPKRPPARSVAPAMQGA